MNKQSNNFLSIELTNFLRSLLRLLSLCFPFPRSLRTSLTIIVIRGTAIETFLVARTSVINDRSYIGLLAVLARFYAVYYHQFRVIV